MSVPSASILSLGPLGSAGVSVSSGGNWIAGAWVEWSAALAEDTYIAGVVLGTNVNHTGNERIEVGIGAAGAEAVAGDLTFRAPQLTSSSPVGKSQVWWEQPWLIPAGSRVSLRLLLNTDSIYSQNLRLMTFPATLTSDRKSSAAPSHLPSTPLLWAAPSSWTWSAWQELTPTGLPAGSTLASFSCNAGNFAEIQFGYGAAGAEVVLTTQQQTTKAYGQMYQPLPGPLPVPANTRLAVRVRQSTTGYNIAFAVNTYGPEPAVPTEIEFDPDSDVSGETVGLTWVEHRDNTGALHVSSKVPLPDDVDYYGGWKEGDIIEWGKIRRALSDSKGTYEGTLFSWTHSDAEIGLARVARYWRSLLAADATKMMLNDSVVIRMISDAARRALGLARTIVRGIVRKYVPDTELRFRFEAEDWLTRLFTAEIPKRLVPVEDFSGAQTLDATGTPTKLESVGKGVPIIYGVMSDANVTTTPGTGLTAPTGIVAYVTGGTPGVTRRYAITFKNGDYGDPNFHAWSDHRGETDPAWITVNDAPTDEDIIADPANHHIVIEVDAQAGAVGGRAYGRYQDSVFGLDGLDYPGAFGVVPSNKWWHSDGWRPYGSPDWNTQKFDGAPPTTNNTGGSSVDTGIGVLAPMYVGKRTVSGTEYHEWLVAGHAIKAIDSWYIDKVKQAASTAGAGAEWFVPGYDAWTNAFGAATYVDINGHRYTLIRGRVGGVDTDSVAQGTKSLTINVQGIESIGDGSGTLITSSLDQYLHFLRNWGIGSYQTGAWLDSPVFPADPAPEDEDVLHMIDSDSFTAARGVSERRVSGGYVGATAITDVIKLGDLIARWNQSCDVECGFNRKTQLAVWMEDEDEALLTAARVYTQERDIFAKSFKVSDLENEMFNDRPYAYGFKPAHSLWATEVLPGTNVDRQSIDDLEETRTASRLDLYMVRSAVVANDIAARSLARSAFPPRDVDWDTGLGGLNDELANIVKVTHGEGIGPAGWEEYPLRLRVHEIDPNTFVVTITARDVTYLFRRQFDTSWLPPVSALEGSGGSWNVPASIVAAQAAVARHASPETTTMMGPLSDTGV